MDDFFPPHPATVALLAWQKLATRDPGPEHFALARAVLRELSATEASEDDAAYALGIELVRTLRKASTVLSLEETMFPQIPLKEEEMLCCDAKAARFLDKSLGGEEAKDAALKLRKRSKERWLAFEQNPTDETRAELWRLWRENEATPPTLRFVWILTKVLWLDVVKERLDREKAKPKALVFPIFEGAIKLHAPGVNLGEPNGQLHLLSRTGEVIAPLKRLTPLEVPTLELSLLPQLLPRGSKLLSSLNAYRLLHLEVTLGYQRVLEETTDARALRFEGGWSGLAEAIGAKGRRAAEEVHAIIAAQAHLCWTWPDGTQGNLLSYESRPARRNQQARVSIILGDALLPDFLFSPGFFGNGRTAREARRLVPVLPLPPMVGRDNEKGAQANLHLRLVAEMRKRAVEFHQKGGILLPRLQLLQLAEEAALPESMLDKALDRWTQDGPDGKAALERISEDKDRYTLGKSHRAAKDFLAQAGKDELEGQKAGRLSRELDKKGRRKK